MNDKQSRHALTLEGIDAFRGTAHVLHSVGFTVPEGGVTALLGRNGVGKTSTIMAILGLIPTTGSITLGTVELTGRRTEDRVALGIGFVPEEREVFTRLTVAENLRLAERGPRPRYELVHDLFPVLHDRRAQMAGTLSGGQQQMLSLARGLLNDNAVLLVDEPTKGLAPVVVEQVVEALARARQESTVLIVEQNLSVASRLAEHAVIIDQGAVVHSGTMQQLIADHSATRRWLGVDVLTDGGSQEVPHP